MRARVGFPKLQRSEGDGPWAEKDGGRPMSPARRKRIEKGWLEIPGKNRTPTQVYPNAICNGMGASVRADRAQ